MDKISFRNTRGDYVFLNISKELKVKFSYFPEEKDEERKYYVEINGSGEFVFKETYEWLKYQFIGISLRKNPELTEGIKISNYTDFVSDPFSFKTEKYGFEFTNQNIFLTSLDKLRKKWPSYEFFLIKNLEESWGILVIHPESGISYKSFYRVGPFNDGDFGANKINERLNLMKNDKKTNDEKTKVKMNLNSNPWDPRHVEYNEDGSIKSVTIDFREEENEE